MAYTPKNTTTLENEPFGQIRLGIQGYSGTGKTFAALTFPNPVVMDIDRGLNKHIGRSDVISVKFWDELFCKTVLPNFTQSELRVVIQRWIETEGMKLEDDQTLVIDGGTGLQNAYHKWYLAHPVLTKANVLDDFAEWKLKLIFFGDFLESLKKLKCHVVYITHESEKKEKDGSYMGKIRPLLTGQFVDQLPSHFTDWFRQHVFDKPRDDKDIKSQLLKEWGCKTTEEFKKICDLFPDNVLYAWQTEADAICDNCKTSTLTKVPKYIPALFSTFISYSKFSLPQVVEVS